jgi:hypothetical protein
MSTACNDSADGFALIPKADVKPGWCLVSWPRVRNADELLSDVSTEYSTAPSPGELIGVLRRRASP